MAAYIQNILDTPFIFGLFPCLGFKLNISIKISGGYVLTFYFVCNLERVSQDRGYW